MIKKMLDNFFSAPVNGSYRTFFPFFSVINNDMSLLILRSKTMVIFPNVKIHINKSLMR